MDAAADPGFIEQVLQYLVAFGFALPRMMALFSMIPVLSRQALPGTLRTGVVVGMAAIVGPALIEPAHAHPVGQWLTLVYLAKETIVGTILGFIFAIPLWTFDAMGTFVDDQRGNSIAQTVNPMTGHDSTPLGELFAQAASTWLVASGGLLLILDATYRSYELWPVFAWLPRFDAAAPTILLAQLDELCRLAELLGAPVLIAMLLAELGLALVGRFAPQLQVSFLAMPIKSALAVFVFASYAGTLFEQGGALMGDTSRGLGVFGSLFDTGAARR